MDAFESLVSMLLRHEGYWTTPSFKVELTKDEKHAIGRSSSPRWELDLVGYKGVTNELLMVECKSYLDSRGVLFKDGAFKHPQRYKLFTDGVLRDVVQRRLIRQLVDSGACAPSPSVTLCLAVGKLARGTDLADIKQHFAVQDWLLFEPDWIRAKLLSVSKSGYENDVAYIVSKILIRGEK